eukprot:Sro942_g222730.2  (184) ;mRNA; r:37469-38020
MFKACSLTLGLLVGAFIYLSTLGAEFVAVMVFGKEILDKSNNELVLFSLGWNLVTTCIALVVLATLRRLVATVFTATVSESRSQDNIDNLSSELLAYVEGRFAVGALVGICISWNLTNMVLGMRPQVIQSCIILAVACLWCRLTIILLAQPSEALIHDDSEEGESAKEIQYEDDKAEPLLRTV